MGISRGRLLLVNEVCSALLLNVSPLESRLNALNWRPVRRLIRQAWRGVANRLHEYEKSDWSAVKVTKRRVVFLKGVALSSVFYPDVHVKYFGKHSTKS